MRFFAGCESLGPMSLEGYEKIVTIVFHTPIYDSLDDHARPVQEIEQTRHSVYYNGVNFILHSDSVPEVTARDSNEWLLLNLDKEQLLTDASQSEEHIHDLEEIVKLRHVVDAIGIPFDCMWVQDEFGIIHGADVTDLEESVVFMPYDRIYIFETDHWFRSNISAPVGTIQCRRETTLDSNINYFAIPSDWM